MTINLYTNLSEPIRADKDLRSVATVNGYLREESSVLEPSFDIEVADNLLNSINYAYISEFGRYYFVGNPVSVRKGLWRFPMRVDVLSTYKAGVRENYAIIERNENNYDLLINDGLFVTQQRPRRAQFSFPRGFEQWDYVIAIAGN